jgi:GAF domain-containing protein
MSREEHLAEAFVDLADTLVADFDVIDFLGALTQHCIDLLPVVAVGIMLADHHGQLHVSASSSDQARLVELFELQNDEGPCLDCYRTGRPVTHSDLAADDPRWPHFASEARTAGFRSAHVLPLRHRDNVIGALILFRSDVGGLTPADARLAQALTDVATIGILQERALRQAEVLAEQLQAALNSRVVIEQAMGVLAERGGLDMERAFISLRAYARSNRLRLADVARQVVDGALDATVVIGPER